MAQRRVWGFACCASMSHSRRGLTGGAGDATGRQSASVQTAAEATQEHALATRKLHAAREELREVHERLSEANERGDGLQAAVQQLWVEKRAWGERESARGSQLRDATAAAAAAATAEWRGTVAAEAARVRVRTRYCETRPLGVRAESRPLEVKDSVSLRLSLPSCASC